ncbi:MAG: c-type cytochrome [Verrucomicrobiaceae bacterium]|nr:c-type cytochrome [Verrucomicrobiaceae bacterium]
MKKKILHERFLVALIVGSSAIFSGCGGGGGGSNANSNPGTAVPTAPALSAAAALGEKIFADKSLSASGQLACNVCHDPVRAHAGNDNRAVPLGGVGMNVAGFRNAPSLNYLSFTPSFFFDSEGTPTGGFDRDGRVSTFAEQAQRPLLAAHEMANGTPAVFIAKLRSASYVAEFTQVFGAGIFDDGEAAFDRAVFALQQYEKESPEFRPFDSKYDYFLAGKAKLSDQELRGLALYNDPTKGNCAGCHPSSRLADGSPPLFTDFTYDNLGVPRNDDIPANADPAYYDLGLCGPDRTDLQASHPDLCGAFKVPGLRNVGITAPYFHNGKFASLREVVSFYVRRDTNPDEWYPTKNDGSGGADKFNDLPPEYRGNVNITEVPYNRKIGDQPALTSDEIDAVVAFLNTLTDGYKL